MKTTWTIYSIIGISFMLLIFSGCKIDYAVRADYIYINETNITITYPDMWEEFNLEPYDTLIYHVDGDGSKDTDEKSYVSPLLAVSCEIIYNNISNHSVSLN